MADAELDGARAAHRVVVVVAPAIGALGIGRPRVVCDRRIDVEVGGTKEGVLVAVAGDVAVLEYALPDVEAIGARCREVYLVDDDARAARTALSKVLEQRSAPRRVRARRQEHRRHGYHRRRIGMVVGSCQVDHPPAGAAHAIVVLGLEGHVVLAWPLLDDAGPRRRREGDQTQHDPKPHCVTRSHACVLQVSFIIAARGATDRGRVCPSSNGTYLIRSDMQQLPCRQRPAAAQFLPKTTCLGQCRVYTSQRRGRRAARVAFIGPCVRCTGPRRRACPRGDCLRISSCRIRACASGPPGPPRSLLHRPRGACCGSATWLTIAMPTGYVRSPGSPLPKRNMASGP